MLLSWALVRLAVVVDSFVGMGNAGDMGVQSLAAAAAAAAAAEDEFHIPKTGVELFDIGSVEGGVKYAVAVGTVQD